MPDGRPKGSPNKATTTVRDAFQQAFDLLGGAEGLARWAAAPRKLRIGNQVVTVQPNLEAFYGLATKLIPAASTVTQQGTIGHAHYVAVEQRDALPVSVHPSRTIELSPAYVDSSRTIEQSPGSPVHDATEVIDFIG